jgi:uncharacterized protein YcbX
MITIRQLWIYPVKSLGGVLVDTAGVTPSGSFALDREWLVVDADNNMLWQGDIPRMALTRTRLTADALVLSAPGMGDFTQPLVHSGAPVTVTMYKRQFPGTDAGDALAAWLTAALGASCRLVRIGNGAHTWDGLNPVHVTSDASLLALNEALIERGDAPVEMERFRPNIVLTGDATPFFEEAPPAIHFGDAVLSLREPCVRCELPNINREDATRGKQPLKLIGAMSKTRETARPASFGTYAAVSGVEKLSVGAMGTFT